MITLAYNIDPLLQEPSGITLQALLDAIPDLALNLPDFRHLAITRDATVKIEFNSAPKIDENVDSQLVNKASNTDSPIELVRLKMQSRFWQNPSISYKNALIQALGFNQVNLWVTTDPHSIIPARSVKNLLIASANILLNPENYPQKRFFKPRLPVWTQASAIIVPHHHDREALLSAFPLLATSIKVIYPALEEPLLPLSWAEQEQLKIRYSGGRDFFLYAGELSSSQELVHLLKAYSLVKKWLMTGMPLILAGPSTDWTPRLEKMLLTYKYRSDVSIYPDLSQNELKELVAGAYALVNPASSTADAYSLQWAFSAGTPVIASQSRSMEEFSKDAVQLSAAGDIDQLAHAIMILYKDEFLRSKLISKGRERAESQNRQNTLQQYKAVIMGLLGDNG